MQKILLLFSIVLLAGCSATAPNAKKKPKNIIFLIGDGMGLTQITAGMYANGNMLNLERCPIVGLHKSHASNNLITDSAAGATAFACGQKTYNGAIGVDPDVQPIKTILEMAEENGLATGLVATSTITHATPASFIAHQEKRSMMEPIAADFLKTEVDLIIGGGRKYFEEREDGRNLSKELEEKGYYVSDFEKEGIAALPASTDKNVAYFTADAQPKKVSEGRDYLKASAEYAVDFLDKHEKNKGFFLMVEGSQIDWGGHAMDSDYIISEMINFDGMIAKVLDFAEKDGNTLVVITADHETGGYAIQKGSTMDKLVTAFTSDYHTATMIPVFAFGPGAEAFSGIYENTAIFHKMKAAFGF